MTLVRKALTRIAFITLLAPWAYTGAEQADKWTLAEKTIVRLPPSAFPQMPTELRDHLTHQGCSIPQSYSHEDPHNVISGKFRNENQIDWAVLCHRNGMTSLLVFWEGLPSKMEDLGQSEDRHYLQGISGGVIGYSHAIDVVGESYIRQHYEAYGGNERPALLDHQGINDIFLEKASVVLYWNNGEWIGLTGAD